MRKTPAIPSTTGESACVRAIAEIVSFITARRPSIARIEPLPTTASQADIIAKVNELIERLQS